MKRDGEAEAEAEAEAGGDDFVHVAEAAPAPEDGPLEFSEPPATRGEEYVRALEAALTTKSDESGAAPLRGLGLGKIKIAAIKGKTTMLALLKKMKREDFPSHRKNRVGWLVALLSLCDTIDAGRAIKAANTPRQLWEYRKEHAAKLKADIALKKAEREAAEKEAAELRAEERRLRDEKATSVAMAKFRREQLDVIKQYQHAAKIRDTERLANMSVADTVANEQAAKELAEAAKKKDIEDGKERGRMKKAAKYAEQAERVGGAEKMTELRKEHHTVKMVKMAEALKTSTDTKLWDAFEEWLDSPKSRYYDTLPEPTRDLTLWPPMTFRSWMVFEDTNDVTLNTNQAMKMLARFNGCNMTQIAIGDVEIEWDGKYVVPQIQIETRTHGDLPIAGGAHFDNPWRTRSLVGVNFNTLHKAGFVTPKSYENMLLMLPKEFAAFDLDHNPQRRLKRVGLSTFYEKVTFDKRGIVAVSFTIHSGYVKYVVKCDPTAADADDFERMVTKLKAGEGELGVLIGRENAAALRKEKNETARRKGLEKQKQEKAAAAAAAAAGTTAEFDPTTEELFRLFMQMMAATKKASSSSS